jgi:hypothetical protein
MGLLVGAKARLAVAWPLSRSARTLEATFADGLEAQVELLDADEELGLALYALPERYAANYQGLAVSAEGAARRGTLALLDGDRPRLVVVGAIDPLTAEPDVGSRSGGDLLVGVGGRVLALSYAQPVEVPTTPTHLGMDAVKFLTARVALARAEDARAAAVAADAARLDPRRVEAFRHWTLERAGDAPGRQDALVARFATVGAHSVHPAKPRTWVPAAALARALEDVEAHGRIRSAYLGVVLGDEADPRGTRIPGGSYTIFWDRSTARVVGPSRARLMNVLPDSPAAAAGLVAGETVLALDGAAVEDATSFSRALALARPGQTVRLRLEGKEGQSREVEVVLGDRRDARGRFATPGGLGLDVVPLGRDLAAYLDAADLETGVVVQSVGPGSPGAEAGLQKGDVIVGSGGGPIRDVEELLAVLAAAEGEVTLTVRRGGDTVERTLAVPASRPLPTGR